MDPAPSSPYADLQARLDAAESRVLAIVARLTPAARRRRPAQGTWCVDEIVDHLAIAIERYRERVDAAFRRACATGGRYTAGLKISALGRWLTNALEPGTKAMVSPAAFRPRVSRADESAAHDAVVRFKDANAVLRRWLQQAPGVETSRFKVSSPAFLLLRFNLDDVLLMHVKHLERHLAQIERTAQSLEQP